MSRLTRLREQDFWQIYFIVTQKDGLEAQSLGSSWGILSEDNDAGAPFIYLSLIRNITKYSPRIIMNTKYSPAPLSMYAVLLWV